MLSALARKETQVSEQDLADEQESIPEEGRPEPPEVEDIPTQTHPPDDEGDDHAELKEVDHGVG